MKVTTTNMITPEITPEIEPNGNRFELFPETSQPYKYELLTGHHRTDGTWKSDEQLKTEYVRLTDKLINRMVNGVEVVDPKTGEISVSPVDYVVWLDKSARPVSWLTKELWPLLAKDKDGNIPKQPGSKFVNIDREQWVTQVDSNNTGVSLIKELDPSIIRGLRSIFVSNTSDRTGGLDEKIDEAPTIFDNKTVLIIDEVRSTGRTLEYAKEFFVRAFPEARIAGSYWMSSIIMTDKGALGNLDIPTWYTSDNPFGRGVGNRNIAHSLKSPNSTQRAGARFLSTAFPGKDPNGKVLNLRDRDPRSHKLREEIHQLAKDAKEHKVFVEPARDRTPEDYDERATRLNDGMKIEDYIIALNALKNQTNMSLV